MSRLYISTGHQDPLALREAAFIPQGHFCRSGGGGVSPQLGESAPLSDTPSHRDWDKECEKIGAELRNKEELGGRGTEQGSAM